METVEKRAAKEIIDAIGKFDGQPLLHLKYDDTRHNLAMVSSLDTYKSLFAIKERHHIDGIEKLRTEIMKQYSILQSDKEFFSEETTMDHFSLVLFTIFNFKFDLNYANTDKLAESVAGIILTEGTNFPVDSENVLGLLFQRYREFGVDAQTLSTEINARLQTQYILFRTEPSFSLMRLVGSNIMAKIPPLFNKCLGVPLKLTMPRDPPPATRDTGAEPLTDALLRIENRLEILEASNGNTNRAAMGHSGSRPAGSGP